MKKGFFALVLLSAMLILGKFALPPRIAAHIYYSGTVQANYLKAIDAIEACDKIKDEAKAVACYKKI